MMAAESFFVAFLRMRILRFGAGAGAGSAALTGSDTTVGSTDVVSGSVDCAQFSTISVASAGVMSKLVSVVEFFLFAIIT